MGFVLLALASPASAAPLHATINRDQHGIPNIIGDNFADIGFGYGYAFAQDNICELAETYVTVRGERSRYTGDGVQGSFGPDGSYLQRGNGFSANNLNSDFFYQRIIDDHTVENLLAQPPPNGPVDEIREGVRGYVAGYNKYLADTGVDNLPDPRCRGAAWVKPITEMDAYRRFYQLALLASGTVAIDGIANAKTPGGASLPIDPSSIAEGLPANLKLPIGSNAIALGSQATANGKRHAARQPALPLGRAGALLPGASDDPGQGQRLRRQPLRRPADPDRPHRQPRLEPHRLDRLPLHPLPGGRQPAQPDPVPLRRPVAGHGRRSRSPSRSTTGSGLSPRPGRSTRPATAPWSTRSPASRCPGRRSPRSRWATPTPTNFRYLNHFFFTNEAQSVERARPDREEATRASPGSTRSPPTPPARPTTRTSARSRTSPTRRPSSATRRSARPPSQLLGLPVLDGSRSSCEWDNDPDAAAPGIFGPSHLPSLIRDDYVTNSNDSYWLSNPEHPLEGFARIIGDERTPRTLRTRLGLRIVQQRLDGTDGLPGNDASRASSSRTHVFNDRQFAGELWRDQLVQLCSSAPGGYLLGSSGPVDVSGACPVLAAWDLHDNLDSNGAILFRRFATRALATPGGLPISLPTGDLTVFSTPFDANDPVNTPSGLDIASPKVQQALADAVTDLQGAGIPLDAPLRGYQYEKRGDEKIPIHGGPGDPNGDFNAINVSWSGDPARAGLPERPARLELRDGDQLRRRLPGRPLDPHLLGVREPELALLRRPDPDVLEQGVGRSAVLRERGARRSGP